MRFKTDIIWFNIFIFFFTHILNPCLLNNSINKIEKILDLRLPEILKPSVQYNQTMLVNLEVLKLIIENSLNLKYN